MKNTFLARANRIFSPGGARSLGPSSQTMTPPSGCLGLPLRFGTQANIILDVLEHLTTNNSRFELTTEAFERKSCRII